jgi:hypothetical protein
MVTELWVFKACGTNAVTEYQRHFPGQRVPNKWALMAVHRHLQETGTFSLECPHKQDENIVAVVECSLHQNTSRISS